MKYAHSKQLDVLKFMLSILVVISHTTVFVGENTKNITVSYLGSLGWTSVHFFLVISGLLMTNSYFVNKEKNSGVPWEVDMFMVNRIKKLALPYVTGFIMAMIAENIVSICTGKWDISKILGYFSELFAVNQSGSVIGLLNVPAWYISAMLLCMIPLYYILSKNETFYLYVFAPIGALFSFGYICNRGANWEHWLVFCTDGIVRAFCGLCFGAGAYVLAVAIKKYIYTHRQRIFFTVIECILYLIIFMALLCGWKYPTNYSTRLLFPLVVGISFSERSYLCTLFRKDWMSKFSKWSLIIYFSHYGFTRKLVQHFIPYYSYKQNAIIYFIAVVIGGGNICCFPKGD